LLSVSRVEQVYSFQSGSGISAEPAVNFRSH
jgi:hypothetical protein